MRKINLMTLKKKLFEEFLTEAESFSFSHTRRAAISNARLKIHFGASRRLTFSEIKIKKVSVTTYLTAKQTSFFHPRGGLLSSRTLLPFEFNYDDAVHSREPEN